MNILSKVTLFLLAIVLFGCAPEKGTTIKGELTGAANQTVKLEKVKLSSAALTLDQISTDANGAFKMNFENGLSEGLYRLSIGAKAAGLVLDGSEKTVEIKGNLDDLPKQKFEISGSASTADLNSVMDEYYAKKLTPQSIQSKSTGFSNPFVGMQLALSTLGPRAEHLALHEKIAGQLKNKFPESDYNAEYQKLITQIKRQAQREKASAKVAIGQEAPKISLPSPEGKNYSLDDLKGKVVLLDFWASWCGPCRKANPHVVELYDKYKDKGFTVYSVSLDGLDERTKKRFSSEEQIAAQMANSKKRWVNAIEKDNLKWDYHVSDLKKWDCAPAKEYGVRSIPRTFLLDREGKIAAINPRGNLEDEILKVL